MRPWHWKLLRDNTKALLPFRDRLRAWKRRVTPYQSNPENDRNALADGLDQIDLLRAAGARLDGAAVLELGSGWKPIVPFLYRAAGARRVWLADVERLIDAATFRDAARIVAAAADEVAQRVGRTQADIHAALQLPDDDDLDRLLGAAGMTYAVPFDPQDVADGAMDLVVSRAVLEHVKPDDLDRLLKSFRRLLHPAGFTCHIVDNSDHWEHVDKSISRVNFLRYGDCFWALTGLHVQNYQNRLRHSQYLDRFRAAGFEIVAERGTPDPSSLAALASLPLAPRFRALAAEDLAILTSGIVARLA